MALYIEGRVFREKKRKRVTSCKFGMGEFLGVLVEFFYGEWCDKFKWIIGILDSCGL